MCTRHQSTTVHQHDLNPKRTVRKRGIKPISDAVHEKVTNGENGVISSGTDDIPRNKTKKNQ